MPRLKTIQKPETLVKQWDRKADKNGLRHSVFTGNDRYVGEWKNNLKHGNGIQVWGGGAVMYEGEWKRGLRDGFGTLSVWDDSVSQHVRVFAGKWRNDKKEGNGSLFYSQTERYEGGWMEDQRSGYGKMFYENGDVYEGEWLEDKHDGRGILLLSNGNRYEGEWTKGKKNGPGRYLFLDKGQYYEGFWVDDTAKCGAFRDHQRERAPDPPAYPIPPVELKDYRSVLLEAIRNVSANQEEEK